MTFNIDYAISLLPKLLNGVVVTLQATLFGTILGIVLGLALAIAHMTGPRWLKAILTAYVEFIRTTPLLVQLFFLFYVLPEFGIIMSGLITGIIGLGMHKAAYNAEAFRAGIESVPRGQWEAARALNFSPVYTWRRIIIPQTLPIVVPMISNYTIVMLKESALLSTITVRELMGTAMSEAALTYRYLESITLVGIFYTVLTGIMTAIANRVEKWVAASR